MAKEEWTDDPDFIEEERIRMMSDKTPELGVLKMEAWISLLLKQELAVRNATHIEDEAMRENSLINIGRDIRDCRQRLTQYKAQIEGRN